MKKKIVFLGLAIVFAFVSFAGCSGTPEETNDNHFAEVTQSDRYLFSQGETDYRIVIPENAGMDIQFAASELAYFFEEATGETLRTVEDSEVGTSLSQKLLSIGKTALASEADLLPDAEEFGDDGYVVETHGDTVIMIGGSDTGSLYAVYDFIERVIGAKVYAKDEIYIPFCAAIALPNLKIREIPDVANRAPGLNDIAVDTTLRRRLRVQMYNEGWILWSHSYFQILPPANYQAAHPDWYSPDGLQLCISNEEMTEEFIKNVITLVQEDTESEYIMLGQQDGANMCSCEECSATAEKYNYSGLMMHFVNKVARAVGDWVEENQPGRRLMLGTFAYSDTEEPPVIYDEKSDTYTPIDDSVLPEPNVALMFAPGNACYAHSFAAECNANVMAVIRGWNAVFDDNILAWIYNAQFGYYFLPFPNWSSTVEDYKILTEHGFNYIYHQGTRETTAGAMSEMRLYVQSKLMWNTDLNMEELTDEFMAAYYKDAMPMIRQYYDLYRQNFTLLERDANWHAYCMTARDTLYMTESVYPKGMLDRMEDLFNEALAAIEKYRDTDKEMYEKLSLRVKKEQLTVRFIYLTLYASDFTKTELNEMINEFETVCNLAGITQWAELGAGYEYKTMANLLSEWRNKYL